MKKYAIIVAGGAGNRMQSELPKQFLLLGEQPLLMRTIDAFNLHDFKTELILVLPENHIDTWQSLVERHHFTVPHMIVVGGTSRYASVKNGLQQINDIGLVAIHDGARPMIDSDLIERAFRSAELHGSGVAAMPLKESIREIKNGKNTSVDRTNYRAVQTPQTFDIELIKKAYKGAESETFTDDASVAEADGMAIELVEGSYANIKITSPEDLILAEMMIEVC